MVLKQFCLTHHKAPACPSLAAAVTLAFILLLGIHNSAFAQTRILDAAILENSTRDLSLGEYTIIQKDPNNAVKPADIDSSRGAVLSGRLSTSDQIDLGLSGTPVWLSIKLFNSSDTSDWLLDLGSRLEGHVGYLRTLHLYELTLPSSVDTQVPTLREISAEGSNGLYKVSLPKGSQKLILLNIAPMPGTPAIFPIKIYKETSFLQKIQERSTMNALFALTLGGMALLFLTLSGLRRTWGPLLFAAYFGLFALIWVIYNLTGAPLNGGLFFRLLPAAIFAHALLSLFMTNRFSTLEYNADVERYIVYTVIGLNIIVCAISFLLPENSTLIRFSLQHGAPLITILIVGLLSFAHIGNGQNADKNYFLSWIFLFAGFLISLLSYSQILPTYPVLLNALWYSLVPQGVFMIMAALEKYPARLSFYGNVDQTHVGDLNLGRLRETKDSADHTRLLKVIEKEREMLAALRAREAVRAQEMRTAKEMADEANRAKSAFLAVVSHEIRTPMTGVMGMVRLLLDSSISKQQRDYVLTIQESSEAMLALLNDILDFEKIQRGKIELENISFDLHRLIQGVITLMSGHAAEKKISLSARMDDDVPKYVKGDPTRLRQVLLNLMGNGIKFTQQGGVSLIIKNLNNAEAGGVADLQKCMIYFAVQDTGIGIKPESQKNLFMPFAQANSSIARQFGGTGLGLAISKGLIESMGSAINISSKENEGATFFFTLEMERGGSGQPEKPRTPAIVEQAPVQPLKILVVDDNTITRKVIVSFLQQGNHEIVTSSSADDALKKIYADAFDLIFMDIEMPGMRGNEATKILRAYGDPVKAALPVYAITGNVNKEDMESYLADGMTGFIAKPIDIDKLRAVVNEVASRTHEREIRPPGESVLAQAEALLAQVDEKIAAAPAPESAPLDSSVFNTEMLQSLKDVIGGSQLNELLTDLIVKTEEILQQLDEAMKLGDMAALAARAHELKGMAGNFGLVEISSIAADAERRAKTQQTDGLEDIIKTLPAANLRAQEVLKTWIET